VVNPGTEAVEEKLAAWSRCYMRQLYDCAMPPSQSDDEAEWVATMNDPNLRSSEDILREWQAEARRIQLENGNG